MTNKALKPLALIVDDDEDFINIAIKVLDNLGFVPIATSTAKSFLAKFDSQRVEFCLIDLKLGNAKSGIDLLSNIRVERQNDIPIFVVSAESDSKVIAHAIEMGATDYVVKPIDPIILASKLAPYFTSDKISENRLPFYPIPREQIAASLSLDFLMTGVDENGVFLRSPNLLSKECAVQVQSAVLEQVTGQGDSHLLTVKETWVEPGALYGAYAEFDPHADEILRGVRRWLLSRVMV